MATAPPVNVYRDGKDIVVPFEDPQFPLRCVKTNQAVSARDHQIDLDCSSMKITQSTGGAAASAIGKAVGGRDGAKLGKAVVGIGEMLATRKKLSAKIGLCEKLKKRFRSLKISSFVLMAGGPLVFFGIFALCVQLAPQGEPPNVVGVIVSAVLGGLMFIGGVVAFAINSLGLLRASRRTASHVWLNGAHQDFIAALQEVPDEIKA